MCHPIGETPTSGHGEAIIPDAFRQFEVGKLLDLRDSFGPYLIFRGTRVHWRESGRRGGYRSFGLALGHRHRLLKVAS